MYHWKKNGVYLTTYYVSESYHYKANIQFADSGDYSCDIINILAPELILHRRMVHLKVTDSTIGIPVPTKPKEIELYYNLSDALLTIKIHQNHGDFIQCYLYDITGRKVLRLFQGNTAQQELHYNLKAAGIKTGPYFVKLEVNGELITKKIILP